MNTLYPIFMNLKGKRCLVVGGGKIALQKVNQLRASQADVTVISPKIHVELTTLVQDDSIQWIPRDYAFGDVQGYFLVISATDDDAANKLVFMEADYLNIPVNVADQPELCHFFLGANHQAGDLKISVSTNGASPGYAQQVRDGIAKTYGENHAQAIKTIKEKRQAIQAENGNIKHRHEILKSEAVYLYNELTSSTIDPSDLEKGTVYLVGAGPGDPGLMTVSGLNALRQAEVVLYDSLVDESILKKATAELILYVGKRCGKHSHTQERINELLVSYALQGKSVVRLKGGDPFIFGRGGEEAEVLQEKGIPFKIIPGVASGISVPAYAGIPLTHRDYSSSVAFVSGHSCGKNKHLPWLDLVDKVETIVVFMGLKTLPRLVKKLKARDWPETNEIAVISQGTLSKQRSVVAPLNQIENAIKNVGIESPALIVLGPTVKLHDKLQWFKQESGQFAPTSFADPVQGIAV